MMIMSWMPRSVSLVPFGSYRTSRNDYDRPCCVGESIEKLEFTKLICGYKSSISLSFQRDPDNEIINPLLLKTTSFKEEPSFTWYHKTAVIT